MDELRDEFDDWFAKTYKLPVPVYYRSIAWVAYKAGRESGYEQGYLDKQLEQDYEVR